MAPTATAVELEVIERDERVQELSAGALELLEQAQSITIVDEDSDCQAVEFVLQVKTARKRWDELRHWFTDPLEKQKKAIISKFSADDAPLAQAERIVTEKHRAWLREQEERARKENERQARLAAARNARAAEKAEARGEEPPLPSIPMATVQAPPKTVKTASGSLTTKVVWSFEVTDFASLPDEFKTPDTVKLGKVVRAGVREIPGVRIFPTETFGGRS